MRKSSQNITTSMGFISLLTAVRRPNVPANRRPPMLSLHATLGGNIAAVCSRCRSRCKIANSPWTGAGSATAANYIYSVAPKDGTAIHSAEPIAVLSEFYLAQKFCGSFTTQFTHVLGGNIALAATSLHNIQA